MGSFAPGEVSGISAGKYPLQERRTSRAGRFAGEITIKTLHPASRRYLNGSVKKSDIMVVKQAGKVWCGPAKHKA